MSRPYENDWRITPPAVGGTFDAISGQVPGIGTCTSKTPCEYTMSSGRQATKSRFCI